MIEQVLAFQRKYGMLVGSRLTDKQHCATAVTSTLRGMGEVLRNSSKKLKEPAAHFRVNGDERLWRAYLALEEQAELLLALADRDEDKIADAAVDTIYVAIGTCISFDIPVQEVFDEIHNSNMSKTVDPEMKVKMKGPGYIPPDIKTAIRKGRQG